MVPTACAKRIWYQWSLLFYSSWHGPLYQLNMEQHNLCCFIVCGMVDCNSLIWNVNIWSWIFCVTQHLYGSICKFIMFVCTWTTISKCSSVLQCRFSLWFFVHDHRTIFYVRLGLTQACPNNRDMGGLIVKPTRWFFWQLHMEHLYMSKLWFDQTTHTTLHIQ